MSIIVYTGKPGAGKTYRVVKELLEEEGRYFVFHNIDGLKESMIEGGRYIQSWVGIDNFFTKAKQVSLCESVRSTHNRSVLVIIDEAQTWFADRNSEIKAWLSWHRHLGQDIKIICQHYRMLNQDFYNLADYEIRGKRGYITSRMVYQWGVNGETFKTDRISVNKAVFAAYTSFVGGEVNKGRSLILYYAVGAFVLAVCMGTYVIAWGLPGAFTKGQKPVHKSSEVAVAGSGPKKSKVGKPAPPPKDEFLEAAKKLSYAGIVGGRVLVQDVETLSIGPLSDHMQYQLVESDGRGCLVLTREKGLLRLNVRPSRYIAAAKVKSQARETQPPAGSRADGGMKVYE